MINMHSKQIEFYESRPTNAEKQQLFKDLTTQMAETYAAKNFDYGDSFSETFQEFGFVSAASRMLDKMNRIKSYAKMCPEAMKVKSESIEDTLMDLANYAIMSVIELRQ